MQLTQAEQSELWANALENMKQLFGEESFEYQQFITLTIERLEEFYEQYSQAHQTTNIKKMRRHRHRLRSTLSIFGGEYWCDRLKDANFTACEKELKSMEIWLKALVSYLNREQKMVNA